ncbi:MAG: hypothetical protein E7189_05965 [Erysipelotrichaceae bacterium]|nr:hypothetical protein [Lachnospiraceae bacterium]MBE6119967.1 hypothetical protein [Erysipelotrichaceae bacterium]
MKSIIKNKAKIINLVVIALLSSVLLLGCDNEDYSDVIIDYADVIIDYADAESFEAALNSEEDTIGKVVTFKIDDIVPDYYLGCNYWSGEHLNMVPREKLYADVDETATVRIIAIMKHNDSWIIDCTKVLKGELPEPLSEFIDNNQTTETTTEVETTVNENEIRKEFQKYVSYMLEGAEAFVTYDSIFNGRAVYSDDTINPIAGRMNTGHKNYDLYLGEIQNYSKTAAEQEFYDMYVVPVVGAIEQLDQDLLNEDYIYYATDVLAQIGSYCTENNFDSINVVKEQLEEFANDASRLISQQR